MTVDLAAEDVEISRRAALTLTGWPADTVLYDADEIGDFSGGGIVAMTENPRKAPSDCWNAAEFGSLYHPEWFEGCVGYWLQRELVADQELAKRREGAPWVDLAAEDVEMSKRAALILTGWPADTVLYEADEIGDFSGGGVVAMTRNTEKAPSDCWDATEFGSLHRPERFAGRVGYWLQRELVADEELASRLEDPPSDKPGHGSGDTQVYTGSDDSGTGDTKIYLDSDGATNNTGDSSDPGNGPSFCPSCGTALDEYPNGNYCPNCGREL